MSPPEDAQAAAILPPQSRRLTLPKVGSAAFPVGLALVFVLLFVGLSASQGTSSAVTEVVFGLRQGATYALIAVGYTMVYGIIELINFAHGDVFTLSGFYAITIVYWSGQLHLPITSLATQHGLLGLIAALLILTPITMLAAGLTGMAIERLAYRRMRNSPRIAALITAIGMSFLLEGIMFAVFIPAGGAIGGPYPTGTNTWLAPVTDTASGFSAKNVHVSGTSGSTTYTYEVFAYKNAFGDAPPSGRATISDGPDALSASDHLSITLPAVPQNADGLGIVRVAGGPSQGVIARVPAGTLAFQDEGAAAAAYSPSSTKPGVVLDVGGVTITWDELFVIVAALVLMVVLQLFITRSRLGKAMRASAQDRDAARICGINLNRTIAATFFIGSALAAAAAIVYITTDINGTTQWNLGYQVGIIAFTAAVLGGIGNIVGAGVGGFVIGLVASFSAALLGGEWSDPIIFAILILILTLRPTGLLGLRVPDRA
ncbi:MAG TPA: branched-chain amino acid ABC transporter permease [Candidatus Dormibacteraeota bacterium]